MQEYTTTFIAKLTHRTPQAIRKLCARHNLGRKVHARLRLLDGRELAKLLQIISRGGALLPRK